MRLPLYQIDAFARHPFEGNPAAVVPLTAWLSDEIMQSIAAENNLSETAFYVPEADGFHIRWFTPTQEIELCGHATLASAHVLFEELGNESEAITFASLSGPLSVSRKNGLLELDFPLQPPEPCAIPAELIQGLGATPARCLRSEDYLAAFDSQADIAAIVPDHEYLNKLDRRGVIVTAPAAASAEAYDFVVRFFAPKYGVPEDPVTGSAYTQLAPYWARILGKDKLKARQISPRGGEVFCELRGDRVLIAGAAVKYFEGVIEIKL